MTPLQAELAREHKARVDRFNAAAVAYKAQHPQPPRPQPPPPPPPPLPPEPIPPQPEPPSQELVRKAAWFYINGETSYPKIGAIQHVVALHYNITVIDLLSHRRTRQLVRPRQVAIYLAKQLTLKSLPEVGRRFNKRDHTTVLHSVRMVEKRMQHDADFSHEIDELETLLKPSALTQTQVEAA
jgi:Bacterial dnaA protein helix-turn-helix